MSEAFIFDKQKNPNSSDLVYRSRQIDKTTPAFGHPSLKKGGELPTAPTSDQRGSPSRKIGTGSAKGEYPEGGRGLTKLDSLHQKAHSATHRGFNFFQKLQQPEGNWPSDYGGPMFLIPGLVIVSTVTQTPLPVPQQVLLVRYMRNHQNKDGGWGLHIEGNSTMFGTVLQYVTLRLLGQKADDAAMKKARVWIQQNGGATLIPPWGKFYLSLLGVYSWQGSDSLFPELWILPRSLPFHPGKYWCHSRMVALGMTYCFGHRITMAETEIVRQLRDELYTELYAEINWKKARKACHFTDEYLGLSSLYKVFSSFANLYEKMPIRNLRKKALNFISDYVDAEDEHTHFINIGPVSKVINSLCVWHRHGKDSAQFKQHVSRWQDYLWVAEDGMKMNGYNGSQLWDVAFTGQALAECDLTERFPQVTQQVNRYISDHQVVEDVNEHSRFFRERSVGGWPFSTADHGWPITDCTSEAMKTALLFNASSSLKEEEKISLDRLKPTIDLLLELQNASGGWASYERKRGPLWVEQLNPSRIYSNIMIEHPYVECTSATVQALMAFNGSHPQHGEAEIKAAVERGVDFIKQEQLEDGSWYGSWAVCFSYGTWFGVEALLCAGGKTYADGQPSDEIVRACNFLVAQQREDGGWGESFRSCVEMKYVQHEHGQVVNTAWALLSLLAAHYPDKQVIENGIRFLLERQDEFGDWPQEGISGVFNKNCMITYTAYRNVFPLWAIGRYLKMEALNSKNSNSKVVAETENA